MRDLREPSGVSLAQSRRPIIFVGTATDAGAPHLMMPALWLSSRGYPVICIAPGNPSETHLGSPLGDVPARFVRRSGRLGIGWHMRFAASLVRARLNIPGDPIFYVHGHVAAPAALAALRGVPRARVVYHTQDFLEPGRTTRWEVFERQMARRAGTVICNEPNRARFMQSYYRLERAPIVVRTALPRAWPTPSRDARMRDRLLAQLPSRVQASPRLIAAGGAYSILRASEVLIRAVARLPAHYVLVFTGMEPNTKPHALGLEAVRSAGLADRTIVLGSLPYPELLRTMAACDIGVLLYRNDGIGNFYQAPGRLTEYLTCGIPIIASNFPGLESLVSRFQLGAVCDPESPADVARALEMVGRQSDDEFSAGRRRLCSLAKGELAFENEAHRLESVIQEAGMSK